MTEFWPDGLSKCGATPLSYLRLLSDLGFSLYELLNGRLQTLNDFQSIIDKSPGRIYRNVIGLKGKYASNKMP
jgi:hypothetical protein